MYTAKPCLCVLAVTRGPATSRLKLQQQPKLQPKEKLSEKHHKAKQFLILQTKRITMNTKVKLTNTLNTPDKTLNAWENKILWYLAPFFPSHSWLAQHRSLWPSLCQYFKKPKQQNCKLTIIHNTKQNTPQPLMKLMNLPLQVKCILSLMRCKNQCNQKHV